MDGSGLGARFWLGLIGLAVAMDVGGLVLFLLIDRAFYRWGAFGTLLGLGAILLLAAFVHDRRAVARARAEYGES